MKILIILCAIFFIYIVWQYFELKKFKVTEYTVKHSLLHKEYTAVVLADLHGYTYGSHNAKLLDQVRICKPDMILVPGDVIVSKQEYTYETGLVLFRELVQIAPVYYSYGNHESRVTLPVSAHREAFLAYEQELKACGVHMLNNATTDYDGCIRIQGLEIPLSCYHKGRCIQLPEDFLVRKLGTADTAHFQILLAHNPVYAPKYASWGANLTLCGHNHGGLVRIPGIGSLISPQFQPFPKYDAGAFDIDGEKVLVSRGLGTHTFHIRIFNRAELMCIRLKPQDIATKQN